MEGSDTATRVAVPGSRPDLGLFQRIADQRVPVQRRVLRATDRAWQRNVASLVDASNGFDDRAVACFLRRIPPGEKSDIHRHNFEALGYVVKGRGYEIHDGERIDWNEGDALYIPPNVWHQHCNADPDAEAIVLLITDWPLLLHLGICTMEPATSWEDALARPAAIPNPQLPEASAARR